MENLLKKLVSLGAILVSLVINAPVLLAGSHEIITATNGEKGALTPEEGIVSPPIFFSMKALEAEEGALFNPLSESQLATIEGKFSPNISIHIAPQIQVAALTQLNFCLSCSRTNQAATGVILQDARARLD